MEDIFCALCCCFALISIINRAAASNLINNFTLYLHQHQNTFWQRLRNNTAIILFDASTHLVKIINLILFFLSLLFSSDSFYPPSTEGTGEFLDAWLVLVEKMVNPEAVLESPHSLPSKANNSPSFVPFSPAQFLINTHKV